MIDLSKYYDKYKSEKKGPTAMHLGPASLNYCHLLEPYAGEGVDQKDAKYSVQIRFPKTDKNTLDIIKAIVKEIYGSQSAQKKWGAAKPDPKKLLAELIHDGDEKAAETGDESYKGCYYLNAKSSGAPGILNAQGGAKITNPDEAHSGMIGVVSVNFYAFAVSGKKGIGCGLQNVLKIDDGEAIASRQSPESDFDGLFSNPLDAAEAAPTSDAKPEEVDPFGGDDWL